MTEDEAVLDYGRLLFVSTFDDPISTFSLDTDRTSCHLAHNWACNGYQARATFSLENWLASLRPLPTRPALR